MLTSLSFLDIGKQWPPPSEAERLEMYEKNRLLFECKHDEVYAEQFKRIERVIGNFEDVISYPMIANFQYLLSLKVADLLFGEAPHITSGKIAEDGTPSPEQKTVNAIKKSSNLINTSSEIALDVSRYGDGLFYVRNLGDKKGGKIDLTQPSIWFPVVSPDNVKDILYHVLAWTYKVEDTEYLKAQIHSKGKYEQRVYLIEGGVITAETEARKPVPTGLDDFAIVQVPNVITSDRVTGIDDYTNLDTIISDLCVRIGQIDRILDKHASPSVSGPSTALEQDPTTGMWRLKMGNYFPRDTKDDPNVDYITWDGQLDAAFRQVDVLLNLLYTISEMGPALLGSEDMKVGAATSGTALRLRMISPLAKVNRIRMRFDPALKKAIALCSQLGGKDIKKLAPDDITITWQDGLPGDPKEEAEIMSIRTGGKATMSVKRTLAQYDGMTDAEAEDELAQIQDEDAASMPLGQFNLDNLSEPPEPEGDE